MDRWDGWTDERMNRSSQTFSEGGNIVCLIDCSSIDEIDKETRDYQQQKEFFLFFFLKKGKTNNKPNHKKKKPKELKDSQFFASKQASNINVKWCCLSKRREFEPFYGEVVSECFCTVPTGHQVCMYQST